MPRAHRYSGGCAGPVGDGLPGIDQPLAHKPDQIHAVQAPQRFRGSDPPFADEIDRKAQRGLRRPLGGARLQNP